MEVSPDSKYGPELDVYLAKAGYKVSRELAPTLTGVHISDAVKSLADPDRVTYRTFETLMALEWSPVCDHLDLILGDSNVYPLCITLLKTLSAKNIKVLENAYGFMCLQFIALAMEIAKIAQNDRFPNFQEEIAQLPPGHSISLILNNYSRELEGEGIWYHIGDVDKFVKYLGWDWAEDGYRFCLPQIGGCGFKDTVGLLKKLWFERARFLKTATVASGIFPGWGGLLYVIWHTVLENLGYHDGEIKLGSKERRDEYWNYMFEISLRYAMCSEMREDPLVYVMLNNSRLRYFFRLSDSFSAVDEGDAILVATCATRKLRSLSTINEMNHMATGVLGYASMLLCPKDFELHATQLYKAAYYRAWNEISAISRMDGHRWYTFAEHVEVIAQSLSSLSEKHGGRRSSAMAVLDLALDWDLHELYAYVLLFPISQLGKRINAAENLPDLEHETGLRILASGWHLVDMGCKADPPHTLYPVWEKILHHLHFHQYVLGDARKLEGSDMDTLWIGATRTFPYERYMNENRPFECSYARCPVPQTRTSFECAGCRLRIYCSQRCQEADWVYLHKPHMLQCKASQRLAYSGR